jgi:single-strand DNA-binding protein
LNINRVTITGNLGADPELRQTPNGAAVTDVRVAIGGREKRGDDWIDRTEWVTVTIWGARAEAFCQHMSKGSPVAIDGHLRYEQWEKDGQTRSALKIVADDIQFLPSRNGGNGGGQRAPSGGGGEGVDDIPF